MSQAYLLKTPTDWEWGDLRDYVDHNVASKLGNAETLTTSLRRGTVYKSFLKRHPDGIAIARYAIGVLGGMWHGNVVHYAMFTKAWDRSFAEPIARMMREKS
jgi:hypothetical protein